MRVKCFFIAVFLLSLNAGAQDRIRLLSPDRNQELTVSISPAGELQYRLVYKGRNVIDASSLGMKLKKPELTLAKFELLKADSSRFDETWKPVWGETTNIRNNYNQLALRLKDKEGSGVLLNVFFKIYNDGIGYRYEFPVQDKLNHFILADELSFFQTHR